VFLLSLNNERIPMPSNQTSGIRPHLSYGSYVARHKLFVFQAGRKTGAPLWRLLIHDWSKLTPVEWFAYVRSFYGPQPRAVEAKKAFDAAWLHTSTVTIS
jgi:hypothetical protein